MGIDTFCAMTTDREPGGAAAIGGSDRLRQDASSQVSPHAVSGWNRNVGAVQTTFRFAHFAECPQKWVSCFRALSASLTRFSLDSCCMPVSQTESEEDGCEQAVLLRDPIHPTAGNRGCVDNWIMRCCIDATR